MSGSHPSFQVPGRKTSPTTRFDNDATRDKDGLGRRKRSPSREPSSHRLEGKNPEIPSGLQKMKDGPIDPSLHRLAGTSPQQRGGLEIRRSTSESPRREQSVDSTGGDFKAPRPSLLGLDRLAAEKRKLIEDGDDSKRQRAEDRPYRSHRPETPSSATPGISDDVREKLADRNRERDRRNLVSSKKEEDRGKDRRRDWRDDRDQERSSRSWRSTGSESPRHGARTPRINPKGT
jgi:hypothetical protein